MRSSLVRMRSSLVVRASDCQCTSCNGPGFDPSIRRHSGIWGAADEAVLNIVWRKNKKSPKKYWKKKSQKYGFRIGIQDPGSRKNLFRILDPRSRDQKSAGYWIPDSDPQHWYPVYVFLDEEELAGPGKATAYFSKCLWFVPRNWKAAA